MKMMVVVEIMMVLCQSCWRGFNIGTLVSFTARQK